ncbi:hypothetical protein [Nocardia rhizosphaerihabitans]|nr:hypothetical protein [Nocardia rhizosphaerihabitans]
MTTMPSAASSPTAPEALEPSAAALEPATVVGEAELSDQHPLR